MPDFPIIDAHVHLYDPAMVRYDWMQDVPLLNKPHLAGDLDIASGAIAIEGVVFAEVDAATGQHLHEALWISHLTASEKRIRALVVSAPLENGAQVEADLKMLAELRGVRGVRRLIQSHVAAPGWCLRDDFVEAVQLLPRHGLSFDICILHPQMADAIELCRRCPDVVFILDHIGKPGIAAGQWEPWASQLHDLAQLPNVSCKISGVVTEANHKNWNADQLKPYIKHVVDCFGFDRVMFGGDWPVVNLASNYQRWVEIVDDALTTTQRSDVQKFYCSNAQRIYRM